MKQETIAAYLTIYIIVALFSMSLGIALAHMKHRVWVMWALLCLFVPPLVGVLLFLPKRAGPAPYEKEADSWEHDDKNQDGIGWWS